MLKYAILNNTTNRTLSPWRIESVNPPNATFRSFFNQRSRLDGVLDVDLVSTYVGKNKEDLDPVNDDLVVLEVINVFGPFVKYLVDDQNVFEDTATPAPGTIDLTQKSKMC